LFFSRPTFFDNQIQEEKMRENPLVYLFGKTWRYSEGNRRNVVLFWAMFIVAQLTWVFARPFIFAKLIDTVQSRGITKESMPTLWMLLGLAVLATVVTWALHGPARYLEESNAFGVRINYRRHLLKGIMTLPMKWHTEHHSGDTIDKIEKGTNSLFNFSQTTFELIYMGVKLVGSVAVLIYFSKSAAAIALLMMAICAIVTTRFDKVLVPRYQQLNRAENRISESVFDAISNITTVIILRVEKLIFKALMRKVEEPFALRRRTNRLNEWKWFTVDLSCAVITAVVLGIYFWQHVGTAKGVLIGSIYLLIKYLEEVNDLFSQLASKYGNVIVRKTQIMNAEELAEDFRPENFTNHVLPVNWQEIAIEGLNFSYSGNGETPRQHLENINMSLRRGERIALVGESGSGKTTLLKLMRGLDTPQSLRLLVDGMCLPEGFDNISRAIALVPQNPEIFATTILENITLGAEQDLDFVRRFTDMACFTDVVRRLPRGFESSIKEKGVNLSGGEQQRLALSRGLEACDDKDLVLLDEPTASLDTATEMRVYQNIFAAFPEKTIVSSIHRLHLLPMFHRIYMFDKGRIIATGSLTDLIATCPQFQKLWEQYRQKEAEESA
jgi:ATP-binding cassette, subfamily B, bacterial